MHKRNIFLVMGLLATPAVLAHDGHGLMFSSAGLNGLFHPWLGLDHLLAMLGMGASLAALSRRAILGISVAMLLALSAGLLGGQSLAVADPVLAAALLVTALFLLRDQRQGIGLRIALVLSFSVLHGMAHGAAAPQVGLSAFTLGVAGSSWLLFMAGVYLTRRLDLQRRAHRFGLGGSLGLAALSLMFGL